ncbi:alpha/beta fold hydrolase [Actinospica robiniae]|uniref:alpha/beta fold hydrolase n=1 Tax=Actinospica robiniae TaxID=304901 RepID=UPI0004269EEC|nr:alpha/beta hydrolase [Actinospica robiniae]
MTKNFASEARSAPTSPPAPPIGGFQEVGGHRLWVHEVGSGGPAVVFLPGAGASGLDYLAAQQGVSEFCTALVYDRGGSGYSDRVPLPRTASAVAEELRELLRALDLAGPYILVAHSLGGAYAHRFAQLYPHDVAGLVWLDGFHRDWDTFMPTAASPAAGGQTELVLEKTRAMRPALRAMFTELVAGYPEQLQQPLIDAHLSDEWLRVGIVERGTLVALADELRGGPGLPDVPLIAITAEGVDPGPQAQIPEQALRAIHEGMRKMAAAVAGSVTSGEHRVVSGVGHLQLCFTHADIVVGAVLDVVDRVTRAA